MCLSVALRRFLGSSHNQHDPACKHQSAPERRDQDGLLAVGSGLDGGNIDNFFVARVPAPLISKSHDPEKDESDSQQRYRFAVHKISVLSFKLKRPKEICDRTVEFEPFLLL
jgi:hypothetical protein